MQNSATRLSRIALQRYHKNPLFVGTISHLLIFLTIFLTVSSVIPISLATSAYASIVGILPSRLYTSRLTIWYLSIVLFNMSFPSFSFPDLSRCPFSCSSLGKFAEFSSSLSRYPCATFRLAQGLSALSPVHSRRQAETSSSFPSSPSRPSRPSSPTTVPRSGTLHLPIHHMKHVSIQRQFLPIYGQRTRVKCLPLLHIDAG